MIACELFVKWCALTEYLLLNDGALLTDRVLAPLTKACSVDSNDFALACLTFSTVFTFCSVF